MPRFLAEHGQERRAAILILGITMLLGRMVGAQQVFRATPTLRISAAVEDLSDIVLVAASARGTIAVFQSQDQRVRFFDSTGHPLGSFGRKGQGPGEFMRLTLGG